MTGIDEDEEIQWCLDGSRDETNLQGFEDLDERDGEEFDKSFSGSALDLRRRIIEGSGGCIQGTLS